MSTQQEISSFIWNVCDDILRGLFKSTEYGRIILPFVVLRRLDCVLEPHKDKMYKTYEEYKDKLDDVSPIIKNQTNTTFYNTSKFDLSRLKGDSTNVLINFRNYVNGYSSDVREILEYFYLDRLVEKLNKNKRLYQLIDKFTEVDLHPSVVSNHQMGLIYEELLRRFSEMSNEESGDHYTPRDIVKLLVNFVFNGNKEDLQGDGKIRSVFDPCCGTGGMLTIGKSWIHKNINPNLKLNLFGQELNDITYSICKSDFLLGGEDPNNIRLGNSISNDRFEGRKFEYMITNPPFGVSWKTDKEFVENEMGDPNGRFLDNPPPVSDGQSLFHLHCLSKMDPRGSRIGIISNGSILTNTSSKGEISFREHIIKNDLVESIISLTGNLFFNTPSQTYLWIYSNKKNEERQGKIQLIDGSSFYSKMIKPLGDKRRYISDSHRNELFSIYEKFEEGEYSKIYPNEFFGYTKIRIEQPQLDEGGNPVLKRDGTPKPDTKKRDHERVPLSEDIEEYFDREVKPYLPESWIDWDNNKVGYEINFTKYFYKYKPLRSLKEITEELMKLEEESKNLMNHILED